MENDREDRVVGGETELHIIRTGDSKVTDETENGHEDRQEDEDNEEKEIPDNIQCEARLVARRIKELMSSDEKGRHFCIFDGSTKEYRKVEFRDITILMRTTKNWSEVFVDELYMMGIPAFADTGTGFFKTVEVQVVLSLLKIIDNPLQDIPLLSVLRSPFVGFSTDELAELRLKDKKVMLFEALKKLAQDKQYKSAEKAAHFLKDFENWREMALYMTVDQLLWRLYIGTGYYSMVGAMPAGEQRQANLRVLFERARQFEETSYKGLFNFINFIEKLRSNKGDMGSAKILGENDNVVRIMSIHKSKGLEFPVVFVSGCGKKFNLQDMNKSILLHQDLGLGPDVVDHKLRVSWPSAAKLAIREKVKNETVSEEMRILYVAMTRAREKLIITGAVRDTDGVLSKWSAGASCSESSLPDYETIRCGNYLDWLGIALMRHKGCNGLRERITDESGLCGVLIEDPSEWRVIIWNNRNLQTGNISNNTEENDFIRWFDSLDEADTIPELAEEISRRLNWEYGYTGLSGIPAKVSVTELKRRFSEVNTENIQTFPHIMPIMVKKPKFMEGKKELTHAEKGTLLHFAMQHLDFDNTDIETQIYKMTEKDLLTKQQAQSIDFDGIRLFLKSDLGKRMVSAKKIYREVPFNIEIPCNELFDDFEPEKYHSETILLQGVIDCYIEESDGIVLLDYKTDYVPEGKEDIIRERYKLQIGYYTRALEILSGKKVKERYIYLFYNGKVLEV